MPKIPQVLVIDGADIADGNARISALPPLGPPGKLLERLAARLGDNGQVLITGRDAPAGTTVRVAEPWAAVLADVAGEWRISGGPAWYTARKDKARLRIGILPEISNDNDPLISSAPVVTAVRHQMYAALTGVPFFGDGGTTAHLLLDHTIATRGRAPLRNWADKTAPQVREQPWPGAGLWETRREGDYHIAVTLDANAQYLWGVNGTYLPLDALTRTGPIEFDPALGAYWRITVPPNPLPQLPHPAGANIIPDSGLVKWVTTPTVQLLAELGADIKVHDAWACPRDRNRRLMDPWYAVLRDARGAALGSADVDIMAVAAAVKDTYSRGISHLGRSPDRRWYRPDWQAILFASARTRMWRAMWRAGQQTGRWPVLIRADAVSYEHPDAPSGYRIGTGMGCWKVNI